MIYASLRFRLDMLKKETVAISFKKISDLKKWGWFCVWHCPREDHGNPTPFPPNKYLIFFFTQYMRNVLKRMQIQFFRIFSFNKMLILSF